MNSKGTPAPCNPVAPASWPAMPASSPAYLTRRTTGEDLGSASRRLVLRAAFRSYELADFLAALLFLASFASAAQRFEAVEPHMGTLVRIQLYAASQPQAEAAFRAAFARIARLDAALSDYRPDSELNRLSRAPAGDPVPVSADLFAVLNAAQEFAAQSNGAFDVTLGPLTHLWREARSRQRIPDPAEVRAALALCGYRKLHLDAARRTATLDQPGMQLDVGGIGKGYAAGEALTVIQRLGIRSALVAVSGDLAIGDPPPGTRGWRIGAGDPRRVRILANTAVSTSGDSEQHLDAGGVRYSHIIDPATGMGLTRAPVVTVIARRAVEADALATAISFLGETRGRELARAHQATALFETSRP